MIHEEEKRLIKIFVAQGFNELSLSHVKQNIMTIMRAILGSKVREIEFVAKILKYKHL